MVWYTLMFSILTVLFAGTLVACLLCQVEIAVQFVRRESGVFRYICSEYKQGNNSPNRCGRDSVAFEQRIPFVYADDEFQFDEDDMATASEGLTDEFIERFQVKDEDKQVVAACQAKSAHMCPICLEVLFPSKLVCKLPCRHMFHNT